MTAVPHPLAPEQRGVSDRDIGWLLLTLMLVIAPHTLRAPWWLTALALCLFGWRAYLHLNRAPLPSRWLLFAIAFAGIAGVYFEYRTIFGRTPGTVLLMLFAGLKLLETRNHRDAAVTVFLCYFLIITNFLFTQSIPTALLMCVALVAVTGALVGFSAPQRTSLNNLRTGATMLGYAVPIGAVLFLLFPRVQGPLWGLPQDAFSAVTGLSDSMTPGTISSLTQSDAIAFRADFEGDPPLSRERYWRGPVMWYFDGRTWRTGPDELAEFQAPRGGQGRHRYTLVLEPHNRNWLFALESPASVPPNARYTRDGRVLAAAPVRSRAHYRMESLTSPEPDARELDRVLERAIRMPAGYNPRATALAQEWRRKSSSDAEILQHAVQLFRDARFVYTLEPPLLGRDAVDEFLFDVKRGFCEAYAGSFAFLMRAAGVAARIVTGYQGGDFNPVDRNITVRQTDAHAWVEVYLQGRGWVRVDPTAASVPSRLESGLARSVPEGDSLPFLMRPDMAWLRSLRYNWEALSHRWNLYVLGYNPDRQRDLMSWFGMPDSDWRKLTATLFTILGILTALLLAWSSRRLLRPDPVQKAWTAFCAKLQARGVKRALHEGPRDFSQRAARSLPHCDLAICSIGELYLALRYGRDAPRDAIAELRRRVRELRLA